jgi:predicted flap endonuclease-1-like 5' DNA nuclease
LITHADAKGATEVAALLRSNLEQEKAAIEKIKSAAASIARNGLAVKDAATSDRKTDFTELGGIAPAGAALPTSDKHLANRPPQKGSHHGPYP